MSPATVPEQFRVHTYITANDHGFFYVVVYWRQHGKGELGCQLRGSSLSTL